MLVVPFRDVKKYLLPDRFLLILYLIKKNTPNSILKSCFRIMILFIQSTNLSKLTLICVKKVTTTLHSSFCVFWAVHFLEWFRLLSDCITQLCLSLSSLINGQIFFPKVFLYRELSIIWSCTDPEGAKYCSSPLHQNRFGLTADFRFFASQKFYFYLVNPLNIFLKFFRNH